MASVTDRLFPDGIGEVLQALLNPEPQSRLPYTYTLDLPPSGEFLVDLASPIRLEPRAIPFRDWPRSHDYPAGV